MAETSDGQPPIPVAVFGAGWVTAHRHVPALRRSGLFRILGVVDRHEERARALARRERLPYWSGAGDLTPAWVQEAQAITVGTPPDSHYGLISAALQAGKHVLTEKPMAMTTAQADELAGLAGRQQRILAVVHNFQFARSVTRLLRMIERGRLGQVTHVLAAQLSNPRRRLPSWYETLPLGLFYDESPHLLYLIRRLAGEPRLLDVRGWPGRGATPDLLTAHFRGQDGLPVFLYMNFAAPVSEWHLTVMGTERLAIADIFRDVLVVLPNDERHGAVEILRTTWAAGRTHLSGVIGAGLRLLTGRLLYGNLTVVERFARAICSRQPPPGIAAEDGAAVVRLQHRLMQQVRWAPANGDTRVPEP